MLEIIERFLWGPYTTGIILAVGVFFTLATGFFPIKNGNLILKSTFLNKTDKKTAGISPFSALATALSGCIGVGNIVGVATAISVGGAGAIFWMWVSAFFGMMTKYAEISLAMRYRERNKKGGYIGSPVHYLKYGLNSKLLAGIYAVVGFSSAIATGNLVQSNTIAVILKDAYYIKPIISGLVFGCICIILGVGGITRISSFLSKFMPLTVFIYVFTCFYIIASNISSLPGVIKDIFYGAFGLNSIVGGGMGIAVRTGFSKGIFSNEAGIGTSSLSHSASREKVPERQAMWGILEVFIDTIVICSLTAFTLLLTGGCNEGRTGSSAAIYTFTVTFGKTGNIFLIFSLIAFAFSTLLAWTYYGNTFYKIILPRASSKFFYIIFGICIVLGAILPISKIWSIADILNCLAIIPNLLGLVLLSPVVIKGLNEYKKSMAEY